jgi:serine protease Do
MNRVLTILFLGVCAFLGGKMAATIWPTLPPHAMAQSPSGKTPAAETDFNQLSDRFEWVARKVSPSVVYVEATKPAKPSSGKNNPVEESGSGVLIHLDGQPEIFVLTNNHVIAQTAPQQVTITLADGRLMKPARIWADPESDVALLRLESTNLPTAALGDSDRARVGQWVLAIGSPFGLNQTVTHGIISARERGQVSLGGTIRIKDFLQTDAAINFGSSGGPLVDLHAEVIGINTAIASHTGSSSGVAFSIPINLVKRVIKQLLETGAVSRGYLGMQLAAAFEPADAIKLGLDRVQGAWVERVYAGTPAAEAGIRGNDVVLQVDNTAIRNENHLINHISTLPARQRVRLQVWRDRQLLTLEAVVGDWSREQGRFRSAP